MRAQENKAADRLCTSRLPCCDFLLGILQLAVNCICHGPAGLFGVGPSRTVQRCTLHSLLSVSYACSVASIDGTTGSVSLGACHVMIMPLTGETSHPFDPSRDISQPGRSSRNVFPAAGDDHQVSRPSGPVTPSRPAARLLACTGLWDKKGQ